MSLDIYLEKPCDIVNITHNLGPMAEAAGIYTALWRPEEIKENITAGDLIPFLEEGLTKLEADPVHFKRFNATNGWGTYDDLVHVVKTVLDQFREYPEGRVSVSR